MTELLRGADSNFVSDAWHAARDRFRAGPLVGPLDNPLQGDKTVIDLRAHSVTRNREIPVKSIRDLGSKIRHCSALPLIKRQGILLWLVFRISPPKD